MTTPPLVNRLPGTVRVVNDADGLAAAAAAAVASLAEVATAATGRFTFVLTGGSTPRLLYQRLAAEPYRSLVQWDAWHVFVGDERAVPLDDPASNFGVAERTLLSRVPIPSSQLYPMRADSIDIDAAAAEYSALVAGAVGTPPRFDCLLLGLGENGHTASLFPGTPALSVRDQYATRGLADYEPVDRITLTYPAITAAHTVLMLVSGPTKGQALRDVIAGTAPAAGIVPTDGTLLWLIDEAAAESIADGSAVSTHAQP